MTWRPKSPWKYYNIAGTQPPEEVEERMVRTSLCLLKSPLLLLCPFCINTVPLVVLSVEDPADTDSPKAYKFRCSSEVVARKVTQLINFAKTVHEYEKTVVQSYRLQMKGIW